MSAAVDMIVDFITVACFLYIGIIIYFHIIDGGFKR